MKKVLVIFFLTIIIVASLVYVDYFNAKTNNTYPKLSLKSENDDSIKYNAVLYRVWYCKANKRYMISTYSEGEVCPKNYEYKNGIYTNTNGVEISKRDLQLLTHDGVYTSEMIENFKKEEEVKDALYVAENYLKNNYKVINETDTNRIIVFPEFKEVDGNFSWEYDETTNYYCLSSDSKSYAKFDNNECGEFIEFKMDKKWCELYSNSTLVYEDNIEGLCK